MNLPTISPSLAPRDRAPELASETTIAAQVHLAKWELLYRQSSHGALGSLLAGILWAHLVWQFAPEVKHFDLTMWLITLASVTLIRLLLFILYRRANPTGEAILRWRIPYVLSLILVSSIWGFGPLLVIPQDSTVLMTATYVFSVGLAGAALSAYGVFVWMAILAICIVLIPMVISLTLRTDHFSVTLAVAGLLFFIVSMRGVSVHSKSLDESFRLSHALRDAMRVAEHQAQIDVLTGLRNRRAFSETAEAVIELARRQQQSVALMLIDIDGFKQINDSHGHAVGDSVLREFSTLLTKALRRADLCGRLGGDEFVVLLANSSTEGAAHVAAKLCAATAAHRFPMLANSPPVTLSIGISSGPDDESRMLRRADSAMYAAKRNGRNQFAIAGDPASESASPT